MADVRKSVECDYCGAEYTIKFQNDGITTPQFCCFCGENFDEPDVVDEEDDGDLDYDDSERDEISGF